MEVVIISAKKQSFNGFNYWKDKSTGMEKKPANPVKKS
jgi:hypothetical protein